MGQIIYCKRVVLRPLQLSDTELIVQWRNDPEISKLLFSNEPLTQESHIKWFKSAGKKTNRLDYVICLLDTEEPIRTVNYTNIDRNRAEAEAGKMIGNKACWGQGLAKEAFTFWLGFGFKQLGLNRVYIKTFEHNIRDVSLNLKLGFEIKETLKGSYERDDILYDVVVMNISHQEAKRRGYC